VYCPPVNIRGYWGDNFVNWRIAGGAFGKSSTLRGQGID
jgi:hypothetical protein